jgi:AcrR family transcriptional regulator
MRAVPRQSTVPTAKTRRPAKGKKPHPAPVPPGDIVAGTTREALLDATERVLLSEGVTGVTTRGVAREAGVNQALVHYYFGSVEQMLISVLERITEQVQTRTRQIYAGEGALVTRWEQATRHVLDEDMRQGYPKIWLEMVTLAVNRPDAFGLLTDHVASLRRMGQEEARKAFGGLAGVGTATGNITAVVTLLNAVSAGLMIDSLLGVSPDDCSLAIDLLVKLVGGS